MYESLHTVRRERERKERTHQRMMFLLLSRSLFPLFLFDIWRALSLSLYRTRCMYVATHNMYLRYCCFCCWCYLTAVVVVANIFFSLAVNNLLPRELDTWWPGPIRSSSYINTVLNKRVVQLSVNIQFLHFE